MVERSRSSRSSRSKSIRRIRSSGVSGAVGVPLVDGGEIQSFTMTWHVAIPFVISVYAVLWGHADTHLNQPVVSVHHAACNAMHELVSVYHTARNAMHTHSQGTSRTDG